MSASPVQPDNRAIWDEYGFDEAERGEFSAGSRNISVTAYRLKDPTGAYAAMQWQRTGLAKPVLHNNYLLAFEGVIKTDEQQALYGKLPNVVTSSLPPLAGYLPKKGRVADSERYVLGPTSLAAFEPRITSSLAAFERGAEAQLGRYRIAGRDLQVALFSYPTPQMAAERLRAFQKLSEASVRRSGPMVVAAFPRGPDAEALIGQVQYEPKLSWTEHVPKDTPQDAAKMILAILTLAGVLIATSVLFGLVFGGMRFAYHRFGIGPAQEPFTTLNIEGR